MGLGLWYDKPSTQDATSMVILYYLIDRILNVFWQAIDHFLAQPMNKDVAKHALSETEWRVLQDFELILTVCIIAITWQF
jgi:hypothetical protein